MRKHVPVIIILLCLAAMLHVNRINNYLFDHFRDPLSYGDIRAFSGEYNRLKQGRAKPLYRNVILFILDGARRDLVYSDIYAPRIAARWREHGIRFANARAMLPTVSAPNYASILTGAPVYLHGVTNNSRLHLRGRRAESLFDRAKEAGLTTAVIGFSWYKDILKDGTRVHPVECCEVPDSAEVAAALMDLVNTKTLPAFTLVHFLAPDYEAHREGSGDGPRCREAIAKIDGLLGEMFPVLERHYPDCLVVVMSDHGMNRDGNHGGSDENTVRIPLLFLGRNYGSMESAREVNCLAVAPTLAALMGIRLPSLSVGEPLLEVTGPATVDYLNEAIARKEKILASLTGDRNQSLVMTENPLESLLARDRALSEEILNYPREYRERVLFKQRLAAAPLLLLILLWLLYRSGPGTPLLVLLNGVFLTLAGIAKGFITSHYLFEIAAAIYLLALFGMGAAYSRFFPGAPIPGTTRAPGDNLRLLALLLLMGLPLWALFVPFHTPVPDPDIFSFRFFSLTLLQPFLFLGLLRFLRFRKA